MDRDRAQVLVRGRGRRTGSSYGSATRSESVRRCLPEEQFDLAFLDADKAGYVDYYEQLMPRLRPQRRILLPTTRLANGRVVGTAGRG